MPLQPIKRFYRLILVAFITGLIGYPIGSQVAGTITLSENPSVDMPDRDPFTYSNDAFACIFVQMKGEVLAAYISEAGAWSLNTMPVLDGKDTLEYPVIASVKGSDGVVRTVLPATMKAKVAVATGSIRSGGYLIETKRPIKSGDSIPVLVISGASVLSVEAASAKPTSDAEPWLIAIREKSTAKSDRAAAIEAWRREKSYVRSVQPK
jgi:hypothetical protein